MPYRIRIDTYAIRIGDGQITAGYQLIGPDSTAHGMLSFGPDRATYLDSVPPTVREVFERRARRHLAATLPRVFN